MRIILPLIALSLLVGCASVRRGLGEYQKAADKGIGLNVGDGPDAAAEIAARREKRPDLPGGLGGDKANAAYTSTPQ